MPEMIDWLRDREAIHTTAVGSRVRSLGDANAHYFWEDESKEERRLNHAGAEESKRTNVRASAKPQKPPEGAAMLPGGWKGLKAGVLFPWIGLPISPGPRPLAWVLSSASNLTKRPRGPSSRMVNEPPPF